LPIAAVNVSEGRRVPAWSEEQIDALARLPAVSLIEEFSPGTANGLAARQPVLADRREFGNDSAIVERGVNLRLTHLLRDHDRPSLCNTNVAPQSVLPSSPKTAAAIDRFEVSPMNG